MLHGVLNIHKPKDCTSYDVIRSLKKILPPKTKIGHAGTLDPLAEGVLPVCIGEATKIVPYLQSDDKIYRATLLFGKETDTQDISGQIINTKSISNITSAKISNILPQFLGAQLQIPPMFSAVKKNGIPLYKLARMGKTIERQSRKVMIYSIEINRIDLPSVVLTIYCSKGTYIRTLADTMGKALENYACLSELVRQRCGVFTLDRAVSLELLNRNNYMDYIIPLASSLEGFPSLIVSESDEAFMRKTGLIPNDLGIVCIPDLIKIVNESNNLICLASKKHDTLRIERLFNLTTQTS